MSTIYVMEWVEHERGWGQRPDGYSLHASEQACRQYIDRHWALMPNKVPDEYDAPASEKPKIFEAEQALHDWVELGDRRLGYSQLKLSQGKAHLADPHLWPIIEADLIENGVPPAHRSEKNNSI